MSGLPSIAEGIPRETRTNAEMGLPEGSGWEIEFADGSTRNEGDTNWSALSDDRMVGYFGFKKQVKTCRFPVKRLTVRHDGMEVVLDIPPDCEVYQAVRSEFAAQPNGEARGQVLGRSVGLVRAGEVIEERFLSALGQEILGMRV